MIHRFTPPTCTLEIEVTGSAVSRWQKQKSFNDIQFKLSFDDPRLTETEQVTLAGDRTQLEQLYQAVNQYIQNFLQKSSLEQLLSPSFSESTTEGDGQPFLQPQGLIAHELFLGSLENTNSGDKINLSTIQLFDLVTALEDYHQEVATIPNSNSPQTKKRPVWITIAASLILLAGLTAIAFNLYNRSLKLETASSVQEESASNRPPAEPEPDPKNDVIPPQITQSPKKPETPKQLENPLSSTEKLPPPPPVDLPKEPPANVPDFSQYPLPKPEQITPVEPKVANQPQPTSPSQSEIAINTPEDPIQDEIEIPDVPPLSPSLLPTEADVTEDSIATANNQSEESSTITESIAKADNNEEEQPFAAIESAESDSNLQLKEVKQYFQQRWQPPKQLKQTIEYRLIINSDGSIVRIIPIGKASEIFVDRTNIPLMGESFITPSATKGNQTIRLLLSPDGEVETFLESK